MGMEEKERMVIQKKIMEIDRQMGEAVERKSGRVPRVKTPIGFPWALYTLAVLTYAAALFGGQYVAAIKQYSTYITIGSYVLAGLAVLKTIAWLLRKAANVKARGYGQEESDEVAALRRQRDALKAKLDELNK